MPNQKDILIDDLRKSLLSDGKRNRRAGANALKMKKEMYIDLVRKLMIRGLKTAPEIQEALAEMDPPVKITTRSIYRYRGIITRRSKAEIEAKHGLQMTVHEMAHKLKSAFEEITRELWVQYHSEGAAPRTKVAALSQIRATTENYTKLLQSMGLIHEAPQKHQYVGADGNPVQPPGAENKQQIIADFMAFVKARYQDPVGSIKQTIKTDEQPSNGNATPLPAKLQESNPN